MWHQKKRLAMNAGEQTTFVNLLYPSNSEMDQAFGLERLGPSVALVRDKRSDESVMAGAGRFGSDDLEVEAELFRIDGDGFALVEGTSLSWEGPLFRSWAPVSVEMDLACGVGVVETRTETRVGISAESVRLNGERISRCGEGKLLWFTIAAGRHDLEVSPRAPGTFDRALREAPSYREGSASGSREPVSRSGLDPAWTFDTVSGVTAVATDGSGLTLAGTSEGGVHLLGKDGAEAWSFEAEGEVRAVHLADIDGDGAPEAIVGTRDCRLYVLDAGGEPRWTHEFPPGSGMRPQRLTTISSADLDGDGRKQGAGRRRGMAVPRV